MVHLHRFDLEGGEERVAKEGEGGKERRVGESEWGVGGRDGRGWQGRSGEGVAQKGGKEFERKMRGEKSDGERRETGGGKRKGGVDEGVEWGLKRGQRERWKKAGGKSGEEIIGTNISICR